MRNPNAFSQRNTAVHPEKISYFVGTRKKYIYLNSYKYISTYKLSFEVQRQINIFIIQSNIHSNKKYMPLAARQSIKFFSHSISTSTPSQFSMRFSVDTFFTDTERRCICDCLSRGCVTKTTSRIITPPPPPPLPAGGCEVRRGSGGGGVERAGREHKARGARARTERSEG